MIQILINNQLLDGYNTADIDVPLSLGIQDATEINKTYGIATKTIKVPATPNNKAIFQFVEHAQAEGLNQNTKVEGVLKEDGNIVNSGYVKVISASPEQYEFTLRGGNKGIWNLISDQLLSDLDWSDLNHNYNITNIMATWGTTGSYVYPLIDYGWVSAWANNNRRLLKENDFYPAFSIKEILKRILEGQGYTISSSFFASDYFTRKYMPFVGKFEHADSYRTDRLFKAVYSGDFTVNNLFPQTTIKMICDTEVFDTGSLYNASTGMYVPGICETSFIVRFGFTELWGSNSTTNIFELRLVKELVSGLFEVLQIEQFDDLSTLDQYVFETDFYTLAAGEKLFIEISSWDSLLTDYILDADKCSISNDVRLQYLAGQTIAISDIIYDLKQLDFVQMVKNLWNLHFDTDTLNRIIYFEPENDFYNDTELDISSLIDNNVRPEITFVGDGTEKIINLGYTDDSSDNYMQEQNEQRLTPIGTHREEMLNQFGENKEGEFRVAFSFTAMEFFGQIGCFSFKLPRMWSDIVLPSEKSTDFNFRVLHNGGMRNLNTGETVAIRIGSSTIQYLSSLPYFYSYNDNKVNNLSLKFETDNASFGLVENYHRPALNRLNYSKQIKLSMLIDSVLISRYLTEQYFRRKVKIVSAQYPEITGFYRLVRIKDYKTNKSEPTEVILITRPDKIAFGNKTGVVLDAQTIAVLQNDNSEFGNITGTQITTEILGQRATVTAQQGALANDGELWELNDSGDTYEQVVEIINNKVIKITL